MIARAHPINPFESITDAEADFAMEETLLTQGIESAQLEELEAAGLLERWERPDGRAWTLTPYAARCLGVEIREKLVIDGDEAEEVGYWDDVHKPLRSPRVPLRRCEYRIPWPERLIDPAPGPGFLVDEVSEEPVKLFAGGGRGGILVEIDRRLKGKK